MAVKNNQPGLLRDAKAAISAAERKKAKQATTRDTGHGRKETRTAIVAPVRDMAEEHDFPGLKAVARITSKRGRDKTVERYFLLTQYYTPAELLRVVREHWGIENVLHWTLDVVLDEDQTRSRKDHAPANLAVLDMPLTCQLVAGTFACDVEANSNAPPGTTVSSSICS